MRSVKHPRAAIIFCLTWLCQQLTSSTDHFKSGLTMLPDLTPVTRICMSLDQLNRFLFRPELMILTASLSVPFKFRLHCRIHVECIFFNRTQSFESRPPHQEMCLPCCYFYMYVCQTTADEENRVHFSL